MTRLMIKSILHNTSSLFSRLPENRFSIIEWSDVQEEVKEQIEKFLNEEIPNTSMLKINNIVKSPSTAAKAMIDFYNQMAEKEQMDFL